MDEKLFDMIADELIDKWDAPVPVKTKAICRAVLREYLEKTEGKNE